MTKHLVCARCGGTEHFYREARCEYHATIGEAVTADRCILDARHEGDHVYVAPENAHCDAAQKPREAGL